MLTHTLHMVARWSSVRALSNCEELVDLLRCKASCGCFLRKLSLDLAPEFSLLVSPDSKLAGCPALRLDSVIVPDAFAHFDVLRRCKVSCKYSYLKF